MSHKANNSFFDQRPEWSKYKHLILSYYLRPYLAKVAKLGKPILLVDLFAGPGRYGDGADGSPRLLALAAKEANLRGANVQVLLVEQDAALVAVLRDNTSEFGSMVRVVEADCLSILDEISDAASTSSVFLHVDPFSISRLHLGKLAQIYDTIKSGSSVEVLFTFMAGAFMRWAHAALRAEIDAEEILTDKLMREKDGSICTLMAEAMWDAESVRLAKYAVTSCSELDAIAGGVTLPTNGGHAEYIR